MATQESDRAHSGPDGKSERSHGGANGRAKIWIVVLAAMLLAAWGGHWLYQRWTHVYIDDARVPKANRIGEENKGWEVAKYLLEFERGGRVLAGHVRGQFARLVQFIAARCPDDRDIRARLAEIGTDLDAMEMIDVTVLSTLRRASSKVCSTDWPVALSDASVSRAIFSMSCLSWASSDSRMASSN